MKYLIPVFLITIISCNVADNKNQQSPNVPILDSSRILQTADGTSINLVDGFEVTDTANDYILFPLELKNAKDAEESASLFSKERGDGNLYWNILFHNCKTGEHRLLEPERKILIGGYSFKNSYSGGNSYSSGQLETYKQSPYIFYTVYTDDYNADKKLGTSDPAYLFVSNPDGSGFKQVSPSGISVTGKSFPKNNSTLIITGIKDSNKDKKFNKDDEQVFYKVDMADSLFKTEEIFNQSFKIKLKELFDKNWRN